MNQSVNKDLTLDEILILNRANYNHFSDSAYKKIIGYLVFYFRKVCTETEFYYILSLEYNGIEQSVQLIRELTQESLQQAEANILQVNL